MIASLIRDNNSYFGLAIGFTVLAGAVVGGGLSGGAFNAAVGLALPLLAGSPVQVGSSSCNSPHSRLSPSKRPLPSHLARVRVHPTHVHTHDPHTSRPQVWLYLVFPTLAGVLAGLFFYITSPDDFGRVSRRRLLRELPAYAIEFDSAVWL